MLQNTEHIFIGGGRDNKIINNVMYNAEVRSIYMDSRGIGHHGDPALHQRLNASIIILPAKHPKFYHGITQGNHVTLNNNPNGQWWLKSLDKIIILLIWLTNLSKIQTRPSLSYA